MRMGWMIVAALAMAAGGVAAGETASAPATTRPATQPAASWATPKEAYLTFCRAITASDGMTLAKSVAWEDPSDEARAKLVAPMDIYGLDMYTLLAAQFPDDKSIKELMAQMKGMQEKEKKGSAEALAKTEELLTKAEVVVDGEKAAIKMTPIIQGGGGDSIKLKKVDGDWRVLPEVVGMPFAPEDAAMRDEMNKSMKMQVRSVELQKAAHEAFMKDLRAKKFASAQEALDAMQKGSMEAMKVLTAETNAGK